MKKYSMILIAIFILTLNGCSTMESATADEGTPVNKAIENSQSIAGTKDNSKVEDRTGNLSSEEIQQLEEKYKGKDVHVIVHECGRNDLD